MPASAQAEMSSVKRLLADTDDLVSEAPSESQCGTARESCSGECFAAAADSKQSPCFPDLFNGTADDAAVWVQRLGYLLFSHFRSIAISQANLEHEWILQERAGTSSNMKDSVSVKQHEWISLFSRQSSDGENVCALLFEVYQ